MQTTNTITTHRNFDADDYAYLSAKGWTDAEIIARWNQESGPCRWDAPTAKAKLASVLRSVEVAAGSVCPECGGTDIEWNGHNGNDAGYRCVACDHRFGPDYEA